MAPKTMNRKTRTALRAAGIPAREAQRVLNMGLFRHTRKWLEFLDAAPGGLGRAMELSGWLVAEGIDAEKYRRALDVVKCWMVIEDELREACGIKARDPGLGELCRARGEGGTVIEFPGNGDEHPAA